MPKTPSGIYYAARGEGLPLVFVHGSGADHKIWGHQLSGLSDQFHVMALDLNGHHKSAYRAGDGLEAYTRDVVEIIEELGQQVVLLGHSLGGAIALNTALRHSELLKGLGLIGTGAKLKVLPVLLELIESDLERAADMILEWEFARTPAPEVLSAAKDQILNNGQEALSRDFNTCNVFDVVEELEKITTPTLVLCGSEDRLTPVKYAEFLHEKMSNTKLEIIPNAGHNVMIEEPEAVNNAIREFATAL